MVAALPQPLPDPAEMEPQLPPLGGLDFEVRERDRGLQVPSVHVHGRFRRPLRLPGRIVSGRAQCSVVVRTVGHGGVVRCSQAVGQQPVETGSVLLPDEDSQGVILVDVAVVIGHVGLHHAVEQLVRLGALRIGGKVAVHAYVEMLGVVGEQEAGPDRAHAHLLGTRQPADPRGVGPLGLVEDAVDRDLLPCLAHANPRVGVQLDALAVVVSDLLGSELAIPDANLVDDLVAGGAVAVVRVVTELHDVPERHGRDRLLRRVGANVVDVGVHRGLGDGPIPCEHDVAPAVRVLVGGAKVVDGLGITQEAGVVALVEPDVAGGEPPTLEVETLGVRGVAGRLLRPPAHRLVPQLDRPPLGVEVALGRVGQLCVWGADEHALAHQARHDPDLARAVALERGETGTGGVLGV